MGLTIGIDIGGSTTKLVGLTQSGERVGALNIHASQPISSAYGALGQFLVDQKLNLSDIDRIALTGVGASFFEYPIHAIPTQPIPEFTATGRGGLFLSGHGEALVVSMGTGTAFVRASLINGCSHIGGSGVGGGTVMGLCSRLTGARHFPTIIELAGGGNLRKVDLMVEDIFCGSLSSLTPELTAANFGNWSDLATESDTALGVLNLVFQTVGVMAVFACRNDTTKNVVLIGSLAEAPQAKKIFNHFSSLYDLNFIIPPDAAYATALGAALALSSSV